MKPVSKFKNFNIFLGTISVSLVLIAGTVEVSVWAADQRYVQQSALALEFEKQRLHQISDQMDELELRVKLGQASLLDKAKLEQLRRKREELLKK